MCLDIVTRKNAIAKSDIVVWKKVCVNDNGLFSPWTNIKYGYINNAIYHRNDFLDVPIVKAGLCTFTRKSDAAELENIPFGNHELFEGKYYVHKIIKCIIPKGTEISYGFTRLKRETWFGSNAPSIVSQRLIIPELKPRKN